jgi:hypothetical protein
MTFVTPQFDISQLLIEKFTLISMDLVMPLSIKKSSDALLYFSAPEMIFIKRVAEICQLLFFGNLLKARKI